MTLGSSHTQSESVMLAYNKRKAQLDRWKESDTERESMEIKNRPKRVKFADKCIFQAACAANDKAQVAKMIHDGYDINAVDEDGITALHQACIEDNFEMVEFLLKHGADVNISDNEGWSPIHAVSTCGYVSIAKLLLEHGANVVALNNDCSIPLDICKSDEIREIFIQDINAKGIDLKEARRGEEMKMMEDVKRWIHNGYCEDPHPTTGATALHVAACKGYIKVLDCIIKTGADINVKDFDGWTPIMAAAHWGQKEACEILLENNCSLTCRNNCDQTALDIADNIVLPVFELFKRKRENNKVAEKLSNSVPIINAHTGPVIQIQRKLPDKSLREEEVKPLPGNVSIVESGDRHSVNIETSERVISDAEETSKLDTIASHSGPSSSPVNIPSSTESSTTMGTLLKSEGESMAQGENAPSWRRTSSLRTRNTSSSNDDTAKNLEKVPVRRTKGEVAVDTSLRRAYSFESDPKFYTRLRDARNRIKASNPSSSTNTNVAILENIPTTGTDNLIPTAYLPSSNDITSTRFVNPANNNIPCALTTSKLREDFEESSKSRIVQRRNKDSEPTYPTAAGSPSLQPRSVGSQDVKVRRSFVPPTRDEESETQRKAHAKRVRETRRSTQGVTLEELKSAEQFVKNSLLANTAPNEQTNSSITSTVPAISSAVRKEDEAGVERRPSWRLRVDETDPSKFSLEDTRNSSSAQRAANTAENATSSVQRSSSLRSRSSNSKGDPSVHGKPPKPPDELENANKTSLEEDKEKDMKNSGAQGAILRKKKTKRRSTGIVQYSHDGTEIPHAITGSDAEVGSGSGPSSDLDQAQDSSKSENGVTTTINYRKLYEEVLKENQLLKGRLLKTEEDMADLKIKLDRVSLTPRITSEDLERREKRALERKLSEMEEELKESRHLRTENQKLRDENGALIRVISKLSK